MEQEQGNRSRNGKASPAYHVCTLMREGKGASGACLMGAHASPFIQCEGWLLNGGRGEAEWVVCVCMAVYRASVWWLWL